MSKYLTRTNFIDVAVPSAVAFAVYNLDPPKSLAIGAGYLAGSLVAPKVISTINKDTGDSANVAADLTSYGPYAMGVIGAVIAGYVCSVDLQTSAICGAAGAAVCLVMNKSS